MFGIQVSLYFINSLLTITIFPNIVIIIIIITSENFILLFSLGGQGLKRLGTPDVQFLASRIFLFMCGEIEMLKKIH
jgi:hypothetical protein